jgi:two-component system LytT family response regulator
MIKTIIVDDEYNAREFLALQRYFPNKFLVLALCAVCRWRNSSNWQIQSEIHCDIQMP